MAAWRVGFSGKYPVEHNTQQFTPGEEVVLLEGFKVYVLGVSQVQFEQLENTVVTIFHLYSENGTD